MYGCEEGELIGRSITEFLVPGLQHDNLLDYLAILLQDQPPPIVYHQTILTKHGMERDIEVAWNYLRDSKGGVSGFISVLTDITQRKKMEGELTQSNQRLFAILDSIDALIYVADMETYEVLFVNKYGKDIWGDISGQTCWKALQKGQTGPCEFCTNKHLVDVDGHPKGLYTWEFQNTVTGRWYYIHDKAIKWIDGRIVRLEIATDITDRKRMEEELRVSTLTDDLTGLLNRRGFFALADQQCKLATRKQRAMALVYIDVDGLKKINDELGHEAGDQALEYTAKIFKKTFRESDIIARIGGDEFAVLLTELLDPSDVNKIINHLQETIINHNEQSTRDYELSVTTGISMKDPELPCSIAILLNQADKSMYKNKILKKY
jgi:diguanylate cyclase (GGDEF)-like protein/PAS domain S-box-containing protein